MESCPTSENDGDISVAYFAPKRQTQGVGIMSEEAKGKTYGLVLGATTLLCFIVVLANQAGFLTNQQSTSDSKKQEVAVTPNAAAPSAARPLDPQAIYAKCRPAVVTVLTKDDRGFDAGQGSGFFIPRDLVGPRYRQHYLTDPRQTGGPQVAYLLTNFHVIRSAATAEVKLDDGRRGRIDDVVLEWEDADLAIVTVWFMSLDQPTEVIKPIAVLDLSDCPEPAIGTKVYAIGSPMGLEASLSDGVVSGRREIDKGTSWIQTTAAISPGSSGGPLLNSAGELVGVVVAQRIDGQNLNFAIPTSSVLAFVKRPSRSRELWRGAGISEEESAAYRAAAIEGNRGKTNEESRPSAGVLLLKAHLQMMVRDYDGAEKLATAISSPSEAGEQEYLLHHTIGRLAEHEVWLASKRWPSRMSMTENYSRYRKDKNHELAKSAFRKTIRLNPDFSPPYERLAECLSREGDFEEALVLADRLVTRVPRCATAYKLRASLYDKLNEHLKARTDLKTAVELGPNDPDTYLKTASTCSSLGEGEQAISAYEAAIRLGTSNIGMCYFNMGTSYAGMGKYQQAIASLRKAKSLGFFPEECDTEIAKYLARQR